MLEPLYQLSGGHPFMVRAMLAALILAPLMGLLGPLVVTRRLAFFSSARGHGALTGVAVALLIGEPLETAYFGTFGFSLLLALGITYVRNNSGLPSDTVVGVFLAFTLGLGICLLVAVTQRFNIHQIEGILFGSIITVTDADLLVLAGVGTLALVTLAPIYRSLMLASVSPALARARGLPVTRHEYLFMVMLTLVIVAAIKIMGALLIEALVLVPAAAARNLARSLRGYLIWSCLLALVGTQGGLWLGARFDVPSGAAIVLALGGVFFLSFVIGRMRDA